MLFSQIDSDKDGYREADPLGLMGAHKLKDPAHDKIMPR